MSPRHRDLIVAGASAGGVEALRAMVATLPADLPATVAIVLHLPAGGTSALATILGRVSALPVVVAGGPTRMRHGMVYVAPPNHHLLVLDGDLVLSHGPTENGHRPAINPLFRSAALAAGPRVIGVILSGVLDDGVAGLVSIGSRGGVAVVQDPADALYAGMPERALQHVQARHVVPIARMGPVLAELVRESVDLEAAAKPSDLMTAESSVDATPLGVAGGGSLGPVSGFTCPDCNGSLMEVEQTDPRYRCRVGHTWSGEALIAAQGHSLERALWTALRTLDEKVTLATRMHEQNRQHGNNTMAQRYERLAWESLEAAEVLRKHLTSVPVLNATETET